MKKPIKPNLIDGVSAITPDWLSRALAYSGIKATVKEVGIEPVGTGQLASSFRVTPVYGDLDNAELPNSFLIKTTSSDSGSLDVSKSSGVYQAEVEFYLDIAKKVDVPIARCYYGDVSESGDKFVLILEDLAPAIPGDQLTGLSVAQMNLAITAMAEFHASTWKEKNVADIDSLQMPSELVAKYGEGTKVLIPTFIERYGDKLTLEGIDILNRYGDKATAWWSAMRNSKTRVCVHGDYRADNLMFTESNGRQTITVIDWQTPTILSPAIDIGHLLGTSIASEIRSQNEAQMLKRYHDALLEKGVTDYSVEECTRDYRVGLFYPIFVSIFAGMQVVQTERGDNMFAGMCNKACAAIMDNNSLDILEAF